MRLLCLLIFTMGSLCAGQIITTSDFSQIEGHIDENSFVLFDVDGTLIVPNDAILHPQEKKHFNRLVSSYTDRDLFREIRMKAPHSLVDVRIPSFVEFLQQQKVPVIALTAAPAKIRGEAIPGKWRVEELESYGFDFSSAFPDLHLLEFPSYSDHTHFPLFKSGVLYSSFHPKGDILIAFLEQLNLKPEKIIFVDDELHHVESVVSALDAAGIPCIGIHYTAVNDFPYELDLERAAFQIDHFVEYDIWPDDEGLNALNELDTFAEVLDVEPGVALSAIHTLKEFLNIDKWLSFKKLQDGTILITPFDSKMPLYVLKHEPNETGCDQFPQLAGSHFSWSLYE